MSDFYKVAGHLEDIKKITNNISNESEYFHVPDELEQNINVKEPMNEDVSIEEINEYLENIVSEEEYGMECELGTLVEGATCIVSFEKLNSMVNEGVYNIISAQCFNKDMISIKYQRFNREKSRKL